MEKVISTDNCMICGLLLEDYRYELTVVLNFSRKPIYALIGKFNKSKILIRINFGSNLQRNLPKQASPRIS